MFERFTDRSRRAVVLAQEEARIAQDDMVNTSHLLLGILHEGESVGSKVLQRYFSLEEAREIVGKGDGTRAGHIPFTTETKKALELAIREALQLGVNYIAPEHILLGLIRVGEDAAAVRILQRKVELVDVRRAVIEELSDAYSIPPVKPSPDYFGRKVTREGVTVEYPEPRRWEYRLVSTNYGNNLSHLNKAGEEGWEAVALDAGVVLCKREKVDGSDQAT